MAKMLRDSGRERRRIQRNHQQRVRVCGCPVCDGVALIGSATTRAAEKRDVRRHIRTER